MLIHNSQFIIRADALVGATVVCGVVRLWRNKGSRLKVGLFASGNAIVFNSLASETSVNYFNSFNYWRELL